MVWPHFLSCAFKCLSKLPTCRLNAILNFAWKPIFERVSSICVSDMYIYIYPGIYIHILFGFMVYSVWSSVFFLELEIKAMRFVWTSLCQALAILESYFFRDTPCTIPTHLALPRAGHKLTALREQTWEQTTFYTLHFALHAVHSVLYTHTSHFTLYTLHSTLYTPRSTLCAPPASAFHSLLCTGTVTGEICTKLFK